MTKKESGRSWFGALFGLIFLFAGLAVAYMSAGKMTIDYFRTATWYEVPADIVSLDLKRNYGDDSTTYVVKGVYDYQYNGVSYRGNRIALGTSSDNIGDYWQELYDQLRRERRSGSVTALVNSSNPTEAILDRTYRWEKVGFALIFVMTFCVIGGFFTWASLRKEDPDTQSLRQQSGEGISSDQKSGSWFIIWFGSVFLLFGLFFSVLSLPDELAKGNYAALFVLLFVLVGGLITGFGIKVQRAYKRFGPTPLFLDPVSPSVGGDFGAWFLLSNRQLTNRIQSLPAMKGTLTCKKSYKSGDDTKTKIIWQEDVPIYTEGDAEGIRVQCLAQIPRDGQSSKDGSNGSRTFWELAIEADFSAQKMGKFSRSWEVSIAPVQTTPASSTLMIPERFLLKHQEQLSEAASQSLSEQFLFQDTGRFIQLISEQGRCWLWNVSGLLFGAAFAWMGYFTINQDWWPGYIFLVVGAAVIFGSALSWGSSIKSEFDKEGRMSKIEKRWFGILYSTNTVPIFNSEQFSVKVTSSSQSGSKSTDYLAMYIESEGNKYKVAEGIKGKKVAAALKEKVINSLFD